MKVRQIMDCLFSVCSIRDSVRTASEKMAIANTSFLIVVDNRNIYKGLITATSLLAKATQPDYPLEDLIQEIDPLQENDAICDCKKTDSHIIPVINQERNVVGFISLRSFIEEYLPNHQIIFTEKTLDKTAKDRQHNSKYTIDDIIGQSHTVLLLKERIIAAAKTKSNVLIVGETGTGKELAAHAIHKLSSRRHHAFIRVNCAAIPDNLLESELFGYEQGAFTGAGKTGHPGKFQLADGGTIFLDEIGDMPLSLQSKILRVLQEREIEKVGGRFPVPIDVRVIAATHCDLLELIKEHKFRQDLFFRLHVIPVQMPPLRAHREDIPFLVDWFIEKIAKDLAIPKPQVKQDFMEHLLAYSWPGNVRELANIVELVVSLSDKEITAEHIPDYIFADPLFTEAPADLRAHAAVAERDVILKAIEMYRGNKMKASEALGISRSSLYNKMKKFNIEI